MKCIKVLKECMYGHGQHTLRNYCAHKNEEGEICGQPLETIKGDKE